ncbi:poly-beta-hydroxybutyrate-responsive repressor [Sporosarcina ureilytica]|uniref:Poly-beta-hydroxybutyrate-responsive repressor n=1 Tax=Sporosarcina ureilytica TaxID=298596 RepID=A0A1D8JFP0_9BACL|nr:poly-beta-hydroxybutyrate-responsive repressor [Sporosarcina ureilytica]AOV07519.1 poly-beta-hydroxybutyrate-responsive repressor [Sporosarcina ureilytica]
MSSKKEESKEEPRKAKQPNLGVPRNFLIPITLLHLRDWNTHGYELMEKITQFGIQSIDQGNFYRILRQLEKDNLVSSTWDTTSSGPAKRIYSITEAGEQYLDIWANSLGQYQKMLDQFFALYNPFLSSYSLFSKGEKEDQEDK